MFDHDDQTCCDRSHDLSWGAYEFPQLKRRCFDNGDSHAISAIPFLYCELQGFENKENELFVCLIMKFSCIKALRSETGVYIPCFQTYWPNCGFSWPSRLKSRPVSSNPSVFSSFYRPHPVLLCFSIVSNCFDNVVLQTCLSFLACYKLILVARLRSFTITINVVSCFFNFCLPGICFLYLFSCGSGNSFC